MAQTIGVLAVQGDFERHLDALTRLNCPEISGVGVRTAEDLAQVDRLIIPGGESTTVGILLKRFGLFAAIQMRAAAGMPIWGTCMGMILLARRIEDRESQETLGLLDITVRRNAFGAQVHSFEAEIEFPDLGGPIPAVFIRAPIVTQCGPAVAVLAAYEGHTVAVRQGKILGTSFHPELTPDTRLHEYFAKL